MGAGRKREIVIGFLAVGLSKDILPEYEQGGITR